MGYLYRVHNSMIERIVLAMCGTDIIKICANIHFHFVANKANKANEGLTHKDMSSGSQLCGHTLKFECARMLHIWVNYISVCGQRLCSVPVPFMSCTKALFSGLAGKSDANALCFERCDPTLSLKYITMQQHIWFNSSCLMILSPLVQAMNWCHTNACS